MPKIAKKYIPAVGDLYAIELCNQSWGLVQLCHMVKVDYYSLTFGLFDIHKASSEEMQRECASFDLSCPFIVATLSENPRKDWMLIGNREAKYTNVDVPSRIGGTWGWFDRTESGLFPKLESYFGVLPWDLNIGRAHIEEHLIDRTKIPANIRYLKDFKKSELQKLNVWDGLLAVGRVKDE